jgi:hypothetical protein
LYTPDHNWFGKDQLVFTVNDGELKSNMAQTGAYRFTPDLNANGFDAFVF